MAATHWQLRSSRLELHPRPAVMGIVNVTPDSFSDGGEFFDTRRAVEHALNLVADGADLLDIGGESTRPYAEPVDAQEELRRVLPVVRALKRQTRTPVSVDTRKPAVAAAVIDAGVDVLNDVEGFRNPAMIELAARHRMGVCVMHMQGTPQTMQDAPEYKNVVDDVRDYLQRQRQQLIDRGVAPDSICIDPGIGFGKTTADNLALLRNISTLTQLAAPVLIGHSRKGFLGKLLGDAAADRLYATIGVGLAAVASGAKVVRVHDVRPFREALETFLATRGGDSD